MTADKLGDEIAEAISDSIDMDWQPSWAVPAILDIFQREQLADKRRIEALEAALMECIAVADTKFKRVAACSDKHDAAFDKARAALEADDGQA